MTINIKYFGLISDITNKKEESCDFDTSTFTLKDLITELHHKYKELSDSSFVIAVNKKIVTQVNIKDNDTIALLPPFAGG